MGRLGRVSSMEVGVLMFRRVGRSEMPSNETGERVKLARKTEA